MSYSINIEDRTIENSNFREVLFTAKNCQLVVMSLKPGEEIGLETHDGVDQFIRIEAGTGRSVLDGQEREIEDGTALVIPAGTAHNIINTSSSDALKLYTVYSPPEHRDGTVHKTKADAMADENER